MNTFFWGTAAQILNNFFPSRSHNSQTEHKHIFSLSSQNTYVNRGNYITHRVFVKHGCTRDYAHHNREHLSCPVSSQIIIN